MSEAPNRPHSTQGQRVGFVTAFRDVFLHDIHTVVDIMAGIATMQCGHRRPVRTRRSRGERHR